MRGKTKIYFCCILALHMAMVTSAKQREVVKTASISYMEVFRIGSLPNIEGALDIEKQFAIKSVLPEVSTSEITLYVDTKNELIPVKINRYGGFELPCSKILREENPPIVSNQPVGSLIIKCYCNELLVKVPRNKTISYRELFFPVLEVRTMEAFLGQQNTTRYPENLYLSVFDGRNSTVVIRSRAGDVNIPVNEHGICEMPLTFEFMAKNPEIEFPGCNVAFVESCGLPRVRLIGRISL